MCIVETHIDIIKDLNNQQGNPAGGTRQESFRCDECVARLELDVKSPGGERKQKVVGGRIYDLSGCRKGYKRFELNQLE